MAQPPVRFEILGDLRAIRDGVPLDLGPAKQRAVLAVLVLNAGRPVPVNRIVDAVWDTEPPTNGANVVQKYVAGLRRVLDPGRAPRTPGEIVALTGAGYVLNAVDVDAVRFEAALSRARAARKGTGATAEILREALGLWRGTALAGLSGPVFDAARARLTEARATAWETWAEEELGRGNHGLVLPEITRLVEEFPLREGLRERLMIGLYQGGRQAEALAVFRDTRAFFLDEFGVEPGERLQETHRRILRGDQFLAGRPRALPMIPPQADPQAAEVPLPGEPAEWVPRERASEAAGRERSLAEPALWEESAAARGAAADLTQPGLALTEANKSGNTPIGATSSDVELTPGSAGPETRLPGTVPESTPSGVTPGITPPGDGNTPPGMTPPGAAQPGMAHAGMTQPGAAHPEMTQPGMTQLGAAHPGMAQAGTTQPEAAQPGINQLAMTQPGAAQPGMAQPGAAQAGMAHPGAAQPGMTQPGMMPAGMTQPGMTPAGMTQPGMTPAGMTPAGMTPAGMTQPGVGAQQFGMQRPYGVGQPAFAPPLPTVERRRVPVGEVVLAALAPIVLCSVGSFGYFLFAGFYRRDRWQFLVAGLYLGLFVLGCFFMELDPTDVESDLTSTAEDVGITILMLTPVVAVAHGVILAVRPGDSPRARMLRAQARHFVLTNPADALRFAVGRPEIPRPYDDGGLADLNHATALELAHVPGLSTATAQRVVLARAAGPFAEPEELISRGVLSGRRLRRAASWLVCVPPFPQRWPWKAP